MELVAAPNGTVYLIESDYKKVLWSFASGPPIYLSYQTPVHEDDEKDKLLGQSKYSFLDCGDDWELYMNNDYGKLVGSIYKFELSLNNLCSIICLLNSYDILYELSKTYSILMCYITLLVFLCFARVAIDA